MAGGNMRVWNSSVGMLGALNQVKVVDAHSKKAGDFTEPRNVNGQTRYFTQGGAKAFDAIQERVNTIGGRIKSEQDPGAIKRFFLGDWAGNKETHVGNPDD